MIGSGWPCPVGVVGRWLAFDCPEAEFLAAFDRWLDDKGIGAAASRVAGLAPGIRARVLTHIEDHLGDPLDAEGLAHLAGLSTGHFARAFKHSFGLPPHRFVLQRRLEKAACRLREPVESVSAIALEFGFADQSHFTRCFGRWAGDTPSAYRARHRDAERTWVDRRGTPIPFSSSGATERLASSGSGCSAERPGS